MNKPGNGITRTSPVRQPVLLGLFAGMAVGLGYLLAGVPNVELMTLTIALAGCVLGPGRGFLAGLLAAVIFSLGSPYGLPHPLLLTAQALGLGSAGVVGALCRGPVLRNRTEGHNTRALLWAGLAGFGATFIYDVLTNLAIVVAFQMAPLVVLTGGVPFFLVHAGVNTLVFATSLPVLIPRLVHLRRTPLEGGSTGPLILAAAVLLLIAPSEKAYAQEAPPSESEVATALPDSSRPPVGPTQPPDSSSVSTKAPAPPMDPASERAAAAKGWRRGLWTPFAPTGLDWLNWYSTWVPVRDGGLGASAVVLGEATTSRAPMFVRDGIPVGTGHILADDPSLVPTEGLTLDNDGMGADSWGGTGGLIGMKTADPDPGKAVSAYRGVKGNHETYFRGIHVLTPRAAWRAAFEFEESLDNEGYNYTDDPDEIFEQTYPGGFPGHGKIRQSRTRLIRNLDEENQLVLEFTNGRKTKNALPTLGVDQQEVWDDGIATTMTARTGGVDWRTSVFWKNRDVEWGDVDTTGTDQGRRKVETGNEGVRIDLTKADPSALTGLSLLFTRWSVYDTGTRGDWAQNASGKGDGEGNRGLAVFRTGVRPGATRLVLGLGAQWDSYADFGPECNLAWGADTEMPWWRLDLYYGGRAPRSDELLTPLQNYVDLRALSLLPNPDLLREKTLRAGLLFKRRLVGLDFAVDGSVRRLEEGIYWQVQSPGADTGGWANGLEMDSYRVTGRVGREGRFLGWGRAMLEGTWQSFDQKMERASYLPATHYYRLHLMWENHFFQEDGILQLALFSSWLGEMADPWDVTREYRIPDRTTHDLLLGFRLVGVNLSVAIRNLTGEKSQMTAGALSPGQEVDLRLNWAFRY